MSRFKPEMWRFILDKHEEMQVLRADEFVRHLWI